MNSVPLWLSPARDRGIALLEVVLAITIFALTAMFVLTGLNESLRAVERARVEADAEDLAVTQLSRVQMGAYELKSTPPQPIDEELFPGWTFELVVTPLEETADWPTLLRVEVIIRNEERGAIQRVWQLVQYEPLEEEQQGGGP